MYNFIRHEILENEGEELFHEQMEEMFMEETEDFEKLGSSRSPEFSIRVKVFFR